MALFKTEYCPLCGKKLGFFSTVRIKDGIGVCVNCYGLLDMDLSIAKFQSVLNLNERLVRKIENQKEFRSFSTTREVKVGGMYFREDCRMGRWYVSYEKNPQNPTLYRYDEIADFRLVEDGDTITSGGLGRAVVGGALFGGTGAIVGAVTGGKVSKKIINTLDVVITLKDTCRNSVTVSCLHMGQPCKSGSMSYNLSIHNAQTLLDFLNAICARGASLNVQTPVTSSYTPRAVDEILKYKELLDKGIINEQQFEAKKKELLGM